MSWIAQFVSIANVPSTEQESFDNDKKILFCVD